VSLKSKGINAERELIHMFWKNGWAAVRVAGSGNSQFPSPDIVAMKLNKLYAIECKVSKTDYQYIPKEDIQQLKLFAETAQAIPIIAVKFNRQGWTFLFLHNLKETDKNFMIPRAEAYSRGFGFDSIIAKE